jgi:hypothetical protein
MASAVGIVLILTMIIWLGLSGPVDLSHLKEWQTLMASVVALIAAGIAYRGATAKVRYDREIAERDEMRRKLALYLKLELALKQLSETARSLSTRFAFASAVKSHVFSARDFAIDEPPELEQAWEYLDVFPRHLIAEIRNVRDGLRRLAAIKTDLGDRTVSWGGDMSQRPWVIEEGHGLTGGVWHSAAVVVEELKPLIQELAPEMDQDERMAKIYGTPGEDIEIDD